MKKTVLFVLVGVLCTAALFADITYVGQNCGQATFDKKVSELKARGWGVVVGAKLSKAQWDEVHYNLNEYNTSKGDTFLIFLWGKCYVVCEFTSDTHFSYWAVSYDNGFQVAPLPN